MKRKTRILGLRLKASLTRRMARQMGTNQSALDRLLDPENASVTLGTLQRAASVVGKRLRLDLVDART